MKKEKQLIFDDPTVKGQMLSDLKYFIPHLENMEKAYNNLEMDPFTDEVMTVIKKQGFRPIEKKYSQFVDEQLNTAGIKSTSIRERMKKETLEGFYKFKRAFDTVKTFVPYHSPAGTRPLLKLKSISYDDSQYSFIITDADLETIQEENGRVYLENGAERDFYNSLCKFQEGYNEIRAKASAAGLSFPQGREIYGVLEWFYTFNPEMTIKPRSIKAGMEWKQKSESIRNRLKSQQPHVIGNDPTIHANDINDTISNFINSEL